MKPESVRALILSILIFLSGDLYWLIAGRPGVRPLHKSVGCIENFRIKVFGKEECVQETHQGCLARSIYLFLASRAKNKCSHPSNMGREHFAFVVPPNFSRKFCPLALCFALHKRAAPGLSSPARGPKRSQQKLRFSLCGANRRLLAPVQGGYWLFYLAERIISRQSRSPRRRPWMSTSAVATLEAKGTA